MKLNSLLKNQTITICDHKWGNREIKEWENPATDIHLEKKTKYKIDGKLQDVIIKLPLNSNRQIKIESKAKEIKNEIPPQLLKEINTALSDDSVRMLFIRDLIVVLKDYKSNLNNLTKAHNALLLIANHFNLQQTNQNIITQIDKVLKSYTEAFTDEFHNNYYINIGSKRIKIGVYKDWEELEKLHKSEFND